MTQEQILEAVTYDKVFGLVECDISVTPHLHDHFAEMPPIFKNRLLSRDDLPLHTRHHAEKFDHLLQPQRMQIGSFVGEKVLILTTLLKWYLEHGLTVSRVYQIAQFESIAPFKDFGESVCNARREGDSNPNKAVIADTAKLIGNSLYGKTITNKERHTSIHYCTSSSKAQTLINSFK